MINLVDLFCGIGGFSLGFKQAGYKVLLAVDNNENKMEVYHTNIQPNQSLLADINTLTAKKLLRTAGSEKINVIIGSPPCKDYSSCKPTKHEDTFLSEGRKGLPYHFHRIVTIIKPEWFVMENVPGYFESMDGEFIEQYFIPFGYKVKLYELNASHFGIPQNRKRSFLIGNTRGMELVFDGIERKTTIREAIEDLEKVKCAQLVKLPEPTSEYQRLMRNRENTVTNHIPTKHKKETMELLAQIRAGNTKRPNYKIQDYDKPSDTITSRYDVPSGQGASIHPKLNRSFTPREAARLQSFDDSFIFIGKKTELRDQIGDAVPPLLAKEIALKIKSTYE